MNSSTMKTDWNTSLAYLGFVDGTTSLHDFSLAGADYGATLAGYKDNFSWGVSTSSATACASLTATTRRAAPYTPEQSSACRPRITV